MWSGRGAKFFLKKKRWKGGGTVGWTMSCAVLCVIAKLCETPWAAVHQDPLSLGILQARILEWVAMSSSRGSSQSRDQTQVSCIADRRFTVWATREAEARILELESPSLLQRIFPIQGSNPGLPHCRRIPYQLSHKGTPWIWELDYKESWAP